MKYQIENFIGNIDACNSRLITLQELGGEILDVVYLNENSYFIKYKALEATNNEASTLDKVKKLLGF
jgi:hypothetical protein